MLTQLFWDVVLQVRGHEELEALIVDGLHGKRESEQVIDFQTPRNSHSNR